MTLKLSGSTPLVVVFTDESKLVYDLDDPMLLQMLSAEATPSTAALEEGGILRHLKRWWRNFRKRVCSRKEVDFAVLHWPEDLVAEENDRTLSYDDLSLRFKENLVSALNLDILIRNNAN